MPEENKTFELKDLRRRYFAPSELGEANEYLEQCETFLADTAQNASTWHTNYDTEAEEFPVNYGLIFYPLFGKRPAGTPEDHPKPLAAVAVYAIPALEYIASEDIGQKFIAGAVIDRLSAKVKQAVVNLRANRIQIAPFSLADFVTRPKRSEANKAFSEVLAIILRALKEKNPALSIFNAATMRQCMSNAAMASQMFPQLETDGFFAQVIEFCIVQATNTNKSSQIFQEFLDTRAMAQLPEFDDLDMNLDLSLESSDDDDEDDDDDE